MYQVLVFELFGEVFEVVLFGGVGNQCNDIVDDVGDVFIVVFVYSDFDIVVDWYFVWVEGEQGEVVYVLGCCDGGVGMFGQFDGI